MRKKIVAGNWKMNLSISDGIQLAKSIELQDFGDRTVIIFPPFTHLYPIHQQANLDKLKLGSQDVCSKPNGAYTGEISIEMLKEVGVEYVLVGHSERREYFLEDEMVLKSKVDALIDEGLNVIFCCGESLNIREQNLQNDFVQKQLENSLFHVSAEQLNNHVSIAYEPIWAIGTGVTASSKQAQEMHAFIRSLLVNKYGQAIANAISILYGGSCKPDNAFELFNCADIDGGLIGGAALKSESFIGIVQS